jgi:hypothetical protein
VGRLCLASDSGMLHPDSRGQSYPNVAGHHPTGRLLWVGDPPPEALQKWNVRIGIWTGCSPCDTGCPH